MTGSISQQQKIQAIKQWLGTGSINLFGLPFAGKDTHGHTLARQLDGMLVGGGDVLRNTSTTPAHVLEQISKGLLAPTVEYLQIMLPYLSQDKFKGKPLILSSVGRWHGEEAGVLEATAQSGHPLLIVFLLHITETELYKRLRASLHKGDRGGREDDAEHKVEQRLKEYQEKTVPVLEFYRDQHMLIEIDAMAEIQTVNDQLINELYKLAH